MISLEYMAVFTALSVMILLLLVVSWFTNTYFEGMARQASFMSDATLLSHEMNRLLFCGESCSINVSFYERRGVRIEEKLLLLNSSERAVPASVEVVGSGSADAASVAKLVLNNTLVEVSSVE